MLKKVNGIDERYQAILDKREGVRASLDERIDELTGEICELTTSIRQRRQPAIEGEFSILAGLTPADGKGISREQIRQLNEEAETLMKERDLATQEKAALTEKRDQLLNLVDAELAPEIKEVFGSINSKISEGMEKVCRTIGTLHSQLAKVLEDQEKRSSLFNLARTLKVPPGLDHDVELSRVIKSQDTTPLSFKDLLGSICDEMTTKNSGGLYGVQLPKNVGPTPPRGPKVQFRVLKNFSAADSYEKGKVYEYFARSVKRWQDGGLVEIIKGEPKEGRKKPTTPKALDTMASV